ncbi:KaiC domain-containing protein, partial [Halorubrum sp. RMP-47]
MSEEDDWFERALRETDEESDERPVGEAERGSDGEVEATDAAGESEGTAEETPDADRAADGTDAPDGGVAEREFDDPAVELGASSDESDSADPFGGAVGESGASDGDPFGGGAGDDEVGGDDAGGDGETHPSGDATDDADPFGGGRSGDDPAADGVPADAFGEVGGDDGSFGADDPFGGGTGLD